MNEAETVYQKRITAFVDIIGFKDVILNNKIPSGKLKEILGKVMTENETNNVMEKINRGKQIFTLHSIPSREFTMFSDSIVISYNFGGILDLLSFLIDVAYLQCLLLSEGLLSRGGIAIGELYHEKNIVFGSALVKAYEIECQNAIYPRIVLDKSFTEEFDKESDIFSKQVIPINEELSKQLKKEINFGTNGLDGQVRNQLQSVFLNLTTTDKDGLLFVDYLFISNNNEKLEIDRKKIADDASKFALEFNESKSDMSLKAIQKWLWLANYAQKKKLYYQPKSLFPENSEVKTVKIDVTLENKNDDPKN